MRKIAVTAIIEHKGRILVGRFIDEFLSESGTLVKWYLCEPVTFDLKPGDDLEWPKKVVEFFSA